MMKKFAAGAMIAATLSGCAFAAKWKELAFADDVSLGMAELEQYCMTHDVTVADVLWANSIDSADIKPGNSVYLPANHADLLAIWQHKGAWQPTALVPVTSAAAAKRATKNSTQLKDVPMPKIAGITDAQTQDAVKPTVAKPAAKNNTQLQDIPMPKIAGITDAQTQNAVKPTAAKPATKNSTQLKDVPMPKIAGIPDVQTASAKTPSQPLPAETPAPAMTQDTSGRTNDDIIAMLREEVRTDARNLPVETPKAVQPAKAEAPAPVQQAQPAKTAQTPAPAKTAKTAKSPKKQETPAKVIANAAGKKPDKILTSKGSKSAKSDIPGLMDPIIIFSPNGDPSKGPMRLVISGDKVEVVQLPKSAAPKRPSLADLDHTFGTNPSYLPHYNMTPKKRDPFILNMGSLAGKMLWPVEGKVSSPFGKWRGSHRHQGIDIPMPAGTPIRSARNGVVSKTGNNSTPGYRGYGNFVIMDHGDGLQTFYAHCLSLAVVPGQRVMQGQIIAYVGSTGRSTGNHLHFEVRINSNKVDPMPYLAGNTSFASHK